LVSVRHKKSIWCWLKNWRVLFALLGEFSPRTLSVQIRQVLGSLLPILLNVGEILQLSEKLIDDDDEEW